MSNNIRESPDQLGFFGATLTSQPDGVTAAEALEALGLAANVNGASVTVKEESGTSYTVVAADNGKAIVFTNASAVTVTLPDGLAVGFNTLLISDGAGGVSVQSGASSTVEPTDPTSLAEGAEASALVYQTDVWKVRASS